jgi:SAM-dependent methyltransferase
MGFGCRVRPLRFPDPDDLERLVEWSNGAFDRDGQRVRVLSYGVSFAGWTDELTSIHEGIAAGRHWIDVASRRHACSEVQRCAPVSSDILEIGCSSGFLLNDLVAQFPYHRIIGADVTDGALRRVGERLPMVPLLRFDLTHCPLPDDFVDVIVMLNVLEHIEDEAGALAELYRITRPGGAVIIEVPAGPSLMDVYDRVLMHCRRYAMSDLLRRLNAQGFIIERQSHLGVFVYPLFYLSKRWNQRQFADKGKTDEKLLVTRMIRRSDRVNPAGNLIMTWESALRPYVDFPFGIRCLVTCRKSHSGIASLSPKPANDARTL